MPELGPDPLRDHLTKTCDPETCGYCKKRRRIEAERAFLPEGDQTVPEPGGEQ